MQRAWLVYLCCVAWLLTASALPALDAIPPLSALVVDQTSVLDAASRSSLEARLHAIQAADHGQVAILIGNDIRGEPLAEYSLRVAESWQLGHAGRDHGLLILVIPATSAARIEVGYGLEGAIPDARASQWVDELIAAMKDRRLAAGLDHVLDEVEAVLPHDDATADVASHGDLLDRHPEWKLPFVLAVFSPLTLFPLFLGRWGSAVSAALLAAFLGGAALSLWNSRAAGSVVAAAALALPVLWGLNWRDEGQLAHWQRYAKAFGNAMAVALFFAVVTLFVGMGLSVAGVAEIWVAPLFAGMLALGVAVFLFPGEAGRRLLIVLRSVVHFVFLLAIAYVALQPFVAQPTRVASMIAGALTACIGLGLYLDSRESADGERTHVRRGHRWSIGLFILVLAVALPLGLIALVMAIVGDDVHMRLAQATAGGASLAGGLALAARYGVIAAVKAGLGGRFGGGGAGRGD